MNSSWEYRNGDIKYKYVIVCLYAYKLKRKERQSALKNVPIHQASRQDHCAKHYFKYAHDTKVRSSASDVPQSYKMAMVPYNPFWAIRRFSAAPPIVYQAIVSGRLPFSFLLLLTSRTLDGVKSDRGIAERSGVRTSIAYFI